MSKIEEYGYTSMLFDKLQILFYEIIILILKIFSFIKPVAQRASNLSKECDKLTKHYLLLKSRDLATNYKDWHAISRDLDILEGNEKWKQQKQSPYYDYNLIQQRLDSLKELYLKGDIPGLVLTLRAGLRRKIGNIGDPALYEHSYVGTKHLIEEYTQLVAEMLQYICDSNCLSTFGEGEEALKKKFDFFYETRQAYGRSALLLSGGASLGCYHFGVVKALLEQGLLPRVISGSSVGSLVASIIGVSKDDELLDRMFTPGYLKYEEVFHRRSEGAAWKRKLFRLLTKGVLMDISLLEECVRSTLGDVTFKEAYDRTGKILNITIASTSKFELPNILNYLTAPHVLIWSAACASCALWGLYEPVELMAKDQTGKIRPYHPSGLKWSDGSVEHDLPMPRLAELFNVNFFIVSQVNPHVLPFLRSARPGIVDRILFLLRSEFTHRLYQIAELGLLPGIFCKLQPLITQKYEGDITVVPKITLDAYSKIISNPNEGFRMKCAITAERSTYPKIGIIRNHCLIEQTLERCVLKLRAALKHDSKHFF